MQQQQQTNLLQPQPQPQSQQAQQQAHQQNTSKIHNTRVKKQLEYLSKYNYAVQESENGISITIKNLWNSDNLGQEEFVENIIGTELEIVLSKEYPFKQPIFIHNKTQQLSIAQLIDEWSPRFKILEMIELIRKRIEQRNSLNYKIGTNVLYSAFKAMDSIWVWVLVGILLRVLVGFGSYSGMGDWPDLGDFEAHRNWMSVTVNRPITKWYTEVQEEPWWRIDYPPVAAYLSYILGSIYKQIQPAAMLLQHGYQSPKLLAFMRSTVLLTDCLFLLPALYLLLHQLSPLKHRNRPLFLASFILLLLKPDQPLIDYGHFQYNGLTLGLILYSFYFMLTGRKYLCCFLYTLAINAKLMSVYFSMGFLAGLVGLAVRKFGRARKEKIVGECIYYGVIVVGTTGLLWLPWLGSMDSLKSVLSAIFPIHRGLYQLKVPNFWCISDVIMKWQNWLSKPTLTLLCTLLCILLSLPSMLTLLLKPTKKTLLLAFPCISMTFFLFSYHVHEKSILFPLAMMPFVSQFLGGTLVVDLVLGGCVGMFHLLGEDGQGLGYWVLVMIWVVVGGLYYHCEDSFMQVYHPNSHSFLHTPSSPKSLTPLPTSTPPQQLHLHLFTPKNRAHNLLIYGTLLALHLGQLLIAPPPQLPYLWNLLFAFYSFVLNAYFVLLCNWIFVEEIKGYVGVGKRE